MSPSAVARSCLPAAVCAGLGWLVWLIFRPGLVGSDGWWQAEQAAAGLFNDWFPPVMAVVLRQSYLLFHSFAPATLVQAVVGCLGVYHVARAALRFVFPGLLAPRRESLAAVGVLVVLLAPPSPLLYYLAYVQNDGWLMPGLLWAVAGWVNLELTRQKPGVRWDRLGWWAAAVLGSAWAVLMRHNAVVLLPALAGLAAVAAYHRGRLAALAAAALVAALPLAVERVVIHKYRVERLHPEDQIIALDLVSTCAERDDLRALLPYTNAHLIGENFREHYCPGFVNVFYWYHPAGRPTRLEYVGEVANGVQRLGTRHAELAAEYRTALRDCPGTLAVVKLRAFTSYLIHDHPGERWHATESLPDARGREPGAAAGRVRAALRGVDGVVANSPALRFVFTNHLPWLVVNLLAVGLVGYLARHGAGRRHSVGLLVLLVPTAYSASHLLAVAGPWYRYMYPAALLVQVGCVAAAVGVVVRVRRRLNLRAARRVLTATRIPEPPAWR
jgi:hypothetical protein